ncbi:MAG: hypothetical protein RL592_39, partial [Verrucomicrobiota bacterium]
DPEDVSLLTTNGSTGTAGAAGAQAAANAPTMANHAFIPER